MSRKYGRNVLKEFQQVLIQTADCVQASEGERSFPLCALVHISAKYSPPVLEWIGIKARYSNLTTSRVSLVRSELSLFFCL